MLYERFDIVFGLVLTPSNLTVLGTCGIILFTLATGSTSSSSSTLESPINTNIPLLMILRSNEIVLANTVQVLEYYSFVVVL